MKLEPALLAAAKDRRMRLVHFRVLLVLCPCLDYWELRRVKRLWVAHELGMRPHHVSKYVRELVRLGYLTRVSAAPNAPASYCLKAPPSHTAST